MSQPLSLSIEEPRAPRDRVTIFWRPVALIPIVIVLSLLANGTAKGFPVVGGFVVLPTLLMLVFRQKYPQWWWEWNTHLIKFMSRVVAYAVLLTDRFPSTDEEQDVHIQITPPDPQTLHRWLPLIKWFFAIPHYIILAFLDIAGLVVVFCSWVALLFTGTMPDSFRRFLTGLWQWHLRVLAYAWILATDDYPRFSLH